MLCKDANCPTREDLTLYHCFDTTVWEEEDAGTEEIGLVLESTCSADSAKALLANKGAMFQPDMGIESERVDQGGQNNAVETKAQERKRQRLARAGASGEAGPAPGTPGPAPGPAPGTPGTPGQAAKVPDPLKLARAEAARQIRDISGHLQQVQMWPAKLTEAHVPGPVITAMTETSNRWSAAFMKLRVDVEAGLISTTSEDLVVNLNAIIGLAKDEIKKYQDEAVTAKRLMAPAPKSKAKAKASS